MKLKNHIMSLVAIISLSVFVSNSKSAVLVTNLDESFSGFLLAVSSEDWLAKSFTVGDADLFYSINSINLFLGDAFDASSPLNVTIYSDDVGLPEAPVADLFTPVVPSSQGIYVYTPDQPLSLTASTTYWIVLSTTGNAAYAWNEADTANFTSIQNWSLGSGAYRQIWNQGNWQATTMDLMVAIDASPIPEPNQSAAVLLGFLSAFYFLKLRGKASLQV